MAVPWLLIAVVGLAATEVSCEEICGNPPPLPTAGMHLYISNPYHCLEIFNVLKLLYGKCHVERFLWDQTFGECTYIRTYPLIIY